MGEKHSFVEVIESELECKLGCHGKLAKKMLLYMFAYNDSYLFPLWLATAQNLRWRHSCKHLRHWKRECFLATATHAQMGKNTISSVSFPK